MFDLSCITLAFTTADAHAAAFDTLTADMVQWHESGEYPKRVDVIKAVVESGRKESSAKVYASRILAWAKAGKTPATIHAMVNDGPKVTGKGGRPKGKGKGASTKPEADAAPQVAAESRVDVREGATVALQGMMAAKAKLVPPAMLSEFENAITLALTILRAAAKPQ